MQTSVQQDVEGGHDARSSDAWGWILNSHTLMHTVQMALHNTSATRHSRWTLCVSSGDGGGERRVCVEQTISLTLLPSVWLVAYKFAKVNFDLYVGQSF